MSSLGVFLVLSFIACTYTAPESRPLDETAATLIESNEKNYTKEMDDVVDDIIKKISANDIDGAEKSFTDFVDEAAKAESRLSDPSMNVNDSEEDDETKEMGILFKHVLRKIAKDGKVSEKKIRDILETAAKTGQLDRGFVSDLINSTLGGLQMGISLGNNNGTANQLCIKLGNIVMSGCRRTAVVKEISNDHNRTSLVRKASLPSHTVQDKEVKMVTTQKYLRIRNEQ